MAYRSKYTGVEVDALLDKIKNDDVGKIDAFLSTTSENPVTNKVLTVELNKKVSQTEMEERFGEVNEEISEILTILNGYTPPTLTIEVTGDGVGANTVNTKVLTNVEGKMTYKLVALTELNYVSDDEDEHTFIGIANSISGENRPNDFQTKRATKGGTESKIAQGTTIFEGVIDTNNLGEYSGYAQDIYIRHRMSGTVRLEYSLGEPTTGLVKQVEELMTHLSNIAVSVNEA